ncbi:MAG: carbamoyltransferase family protein [Kiloniellales bacterium]
MAAVLGITAFHAGSAACLVIDGEPVFAIAEERLNRVKYYAGFPATAIQACLDHAGMGWSDIDHVAVGRDPSANRLQKSLFALRHSGKLGNILAIRKKARRFLGVKELIAQECGVTLGDLRFELHNVEHHLAHNASAYFISPWERAAGLSVDGSGDFVSVMMTRCEGPDIQVLSRVFVPHSLGTLYTMICDFIGYSSYGDEGKVMGLAPYGEDEFGDLFDDMIALEGDGFRLNSSYFRPFGSDQGLELRDDGTMAVHRQYANRMTERFGAPREKDAEYSQRDMNLAFGVQKRFEQIYMHLLNRLHQKVPSDRVVLAGGCALNSVANGKLFDQTPFAETCVQPAAGDDGLSMGAALYVSNAVLRENKRWAMTNAYLGDEFPDSIIQAELDARGVAYRKLDRQNLIRETAEQISAGLVIGWFQGRMEWGPRALGNRSILVHPGYPGMKDILNARIKRREWFRPFAPAVLTDRQGEVFEHDHPSPFMMHVYKIRPAWRERLEAVNHVDDTGRLQTVSREENPLYYDLISAFCDKTGIPVLLNTSFNENEPIVHSPAEAIDCFLRTKMDVLAIGSFLCRKDQDKDTVAS